MHPHRNAPLRYRFEDLRKARNHVVAFEGRSLFFFRHPRLELFPGSRVQMEWTFQNAEQARLLHGVAISNVDRCGAWIELRDTRPMRELRRLRAERKYRRMATELRATVLRGTRRSHARILDLSAGGARLDGAGAAVRGERLAIRGVLPDERVEVDAGFATVVWCDRAEMGVQFDDHSAESRAELMRLVRFVAEEWATAIEGRHPHWCCAEHGTLEVPLPEAALLRLTA
jgi:PilZ domain